MSRTRNAKRVLWGVGVAGALGLGLWWRYPARPIVPASQSVSQSGFVGSAAAPKGSEVIQERVYRLPHSTVYTLQIPVHRFRVVPAMANTVATVAEFAQQHRAIAVINGGFFDPQNQQSTSYIVLDGQMVADPHQNTRLTQNPALTPYLDRIFNRSELRRYRCGSGITYAIALRQAAGNCQLLDALGAGPGLLPDLMLQPEGFLDETAGTIIRDSLGYRQPHARSAVGILANGDLLWVMVAQQPAAPQSSGMTLPELAAFLKSRRAVQAINLDGGSSTSLYYQGRAVYGAVDRSGVSVQRPVKSALLVLAGEEH